MAIDQVEAPRAPAKRRWLSAVVVALVIVVAVVSWMVLRPHSDGSPSGSTTFVGFVTNTPATEGIICVHPDASGPTDSASGGGDLCAKAYPSRGLTVDGIQRGDRVRIVYFVTTAQDGEDVSGALVLPANLPAPPGA